MISKMIRYASEKHAGQKRKKNGRPYFRDHCLGLLEDVCNDSTYGDDETAHLIILGHDIVEDCTEKDTDKARDALYREITSKFGVQVCTGIGELTDEYTKARHPNMNRRERKYAELKRLRGISDRGKILKLYDRRINLQDAIDVEDWNTTYARESWELALHLGGVNGYRVALRVATLASKIQDNA